MVRNRRSGTRRKTACTPRRLFSRGALPDRSPVAARPERGSDDSIRPFQIESSSLRGRHVRLGPALDRIIGQHGYPEPVALLLGQAVALAALLAGASKYEGI